LGFRILDLIARIINFCMPPNWRRILPITAEFFRQEFVAASQ
jgi:hypothetical protein